MVETVRLVSDGEELVLSEGEVFRMHPNPDARDATAERRREAALAKRIAVQYLGFHDVQGRREYALNAQYGGDQIRRYTVWIELAAFSRRQALLQDGPDICYQKLVRELAVCESQGADDKIEVTAGDLLAYRESHAPPARRSFFPPRVPQPAKT